MGVPQASKHFVTFRSGPVRGISKGRLKEVQCFSAGVHGACRFPKFPCEGGVYLGLGREARSGWLRGDAEGRRNGEDPFQLTL